MQSCVGEVRFHELQPAQIVQATYMGGDFVGSSVITERYRFDPLLLIKPVEYALGM